MTCEEFSNQFDTLLNSYNIQAGFGEGSNKQGGIALDEYEKSVLLTQAQDQIVKSYFDRTLNNQGQGFDDSARRQVDFSSLIKVKRYAGDGKDILVHNDKTCYDDRGLKVNLGEETRILFILNERLEVGTDASKRIYVIVPINYKEYDREMSKAYAQPLKKQAWRLFSNNSTGYDIDSEIIPIYGSTESQETTVETYYMQCGKKLDDTYEWTRLDSLTPIQEAQYLKGTVTSEDDLPADANDLDIYQVNKTDVSTVAKPVSYVVRYVERPTPIVLRDLPNGLTIDGEADYKECSLNPILHMDILNRAFELAVTTRGGGTAQSQSEKS